MSRVESFEAALNRAKIVVVTDWFNELDVFVGALTSQSRAERAQSITGTCQYCLRVGLPLHVEKASGYFHMHCAECIAWLKSIAEDVYEDEDVRDDIEWDGDQAYDEPEEHECACCGSISYARSADGYCSACRRFEKPDE